LLGGAKAISNDYRINSNDSIGSKIPQKFIPVHQGFFVIASLDDELKNITTTVQGGKIVFKNSQRIFAAEADGTSVFMKSENPKNGVAKYAAKKDERQKIWLMYDSPKGYHRQLLIGADENTTNNFDIGYDAPIADIGKEDMFWMFDSAKFVIQGVPNFDKDQEFPLGLKVAKAGLVRIKIDALENVENNVQMYIKDNATLRYYKINDKPFEMNLEIGDYLDRFSLTFSPSQKSEQKIEEDSVMGVEEDFLENDIQIFMSNETAEIKIIKPVDITFKSIELYNILGQKIQSWNKNLSYASFTLPVKVATGVYVITVNTSTGRMSKKIIVE